MFFCFPCTELSLNLIEVIKLKFKPSVALCSLYNDNLAAMPVCYEQSISFSFMK
jgi:hypothetical protein